MRKSGARFSLRNGFVVALAAIVGLTFLVRLAVSVERVGADAAVTAPSPVTDMATYRELAGKIAEGTFTGPFYYQPLYYVGFLAPLHRFFGDSLWAFFIAQCLVSAATAWFVGLTAALMFGRRAGLLAASIVLLARPLGFYAPYALIETLQGFWMALLAYWLARAVRGDRSRDWALVGLIAGLAALTRGNIAAIVPGLVVLALWSGWRRRVGVRRCRSTVLLLAAFIAAQVPFAWRNTRIEGRLRGPSTAAGAVLSFGNTPESPPAGNFLEGLPGIAPESPTQRYWLQTQDRTAIFSRVIRFALAHPGAWLELTFRKLLLFWDGREIPNNVCERAVIDRTPILRWTGLLSFGALCVLALGGVGARRPRFRAPNARLALFYLIVAYWVSIAAFYIFSRFRAPVVPLLAIFASGLLGYRLRDLAKRRKNWIPALAALVFGAFLTQAAFDCYGYYLEAPLIAAVNPAGVRSDLGDRVTVLDNGPMICGDWRDVPLKPGDRVVKTFYARGLSFSGPAECVLTFLADGPAALAFTLNGQPFEAQFTGPELGQRSFLTSVAENGEITLEIQRVQGHVAGVLDHRRHFGRTRINGVDPEGELVARLFLKKP